MVLAHGGRYLDVVAQLLPRLDGIVGRAPAKLARCRERGGELLVDDSQQAFGDAVRRATDGHGADVVLDNMGAAYLPRNVDVLAVGGRLQVIGLQGGAKGELDLGRLMSKRAQVRGTTLRARPTAEKAAICARVAADVWPMVADGRIRTVIDRVVR